ncbi:MAG: hypothetical protein PHE80_04745 [Candidatus Omnitrophica bacterium]|nr:hypothetical protein [Candidatus Omnitrophota bacterium]MDD5737244.1 hypothetical protein [Candidatus Omnitrophota bacterium]
MKKIYVNAFLGVIIAVAAVAIPAHAGALDNVIREDAGYYADQKTAEGAVTSIDGDGGVFTIKPFDVSQTNSDELIFRVMPDTQVYKAGKAIDSSDIRVGDVVTVEYLDDKAGLKAATVDVQ